MEVRVAGCCVSRGMTLSGLSLSRVGRWISRAVHDGPPHCIGADDLLASISLVEGVKEGGALQRVGTVKHAC